MRTVLGTLSLAILTSSALAQPSTSTRAPAFDDYPVREVYRGPAARPVIDTADKRVFRTRIREAAQEQVNFAGHHVLTLWGCGAGCSMGAVVNLRTGAAAVILFSICCDRGEVEDRVEYRLNSKLVIFTGLRNEKGPYGWHYYLFDKDRFRHIKTLPSGEAEESRLPDGQSRQTGITENVARRPAGGNGDPGRLRHS
jgi:hypothetical protein